MGFFGRNAYTVIAVSESGKTITLQQDKATRLDDPVIIPGGFAGHCTNQKEIRWSYEPDATGRIIKATMRKDGRYREAGSRNPLIEGRHEFYDYNF